MLTDSVCVLAISSIVVLPLERRIPCADLLSAQAAPDRCKIGLPSVVDKNSWLRPSSKELIFLSVIGISALFLVSSVGSRKGRGGAGRSDSSWIGLE